MPAVRHCSRTDTFELKHQMVKILGVEKSENYFNLLTRFLSLKMVKTEFDKICVRLIGRENIRLHNELIRAILRNASVAKTPPPKQVKKDNVLSFKDQNGGLQAICRDAFPKSPKKGRTPNLRESKFKDRPSVRKAEDLAMTRGIKPPRVESEQDELSRVDCKRIPITAPFGVNIHSSETRKVPHDGLGSGYYTETCHYSGQLLSRSSLENRLKQQLKTEGLDVSMDCINLVNNGLESYLKRVIKPSLELASSRFLHEPRKRFTASLLDFQLATMTNPKMIGEDWSIQLEKIRLSAFDNK